MFIICKLLLLIILMTRLLWGMEKDKQTNTLLFQGQSNKGLYSISQFLSPGIKASPFVSNKEYDSSAGVSTSSVCFSPQIKNFVISSRSHALLGQQVKTKLWHLRLGHVTNEVLQHMLKASHISVTPDPTYALCESCLQGKMHKLPFPSSSTISSKPFSKLHFDVWGTSACIALGGYRYYLTFIDDCTRHVVYNEDVFPFKAHQYSLTTPSISQSSPASPSGMSPVPVIMPSPPSSSPTIQPLLSPSMHSTSSPRLSPTIFYSTSSAGATTSDNNMLPIIYADQLEVILPHISDSSESAHSISNSTNNCHPMQTRSKSGIIQHRQFPEYSSFTTQLHSITELDTPSHFKAALGKP
ncbi:unnamed protein product, partial [Prunus brigantina]